MNPNINDDALHVLANSPSLRHLDLSYTKIGNQTVNALAHNNLLSLRLRDVAISASAFAHLASLDQLVVLDLSRGPWLPSVPGFESEPLSSTLLPGLNGGRFKEFKRLASTQRPLSESNVYVASAAFPTSLRWLDISGWNLSPSVLTKISALPRLEYVNLAGQHVDSDLLGSFANNSKLKSLGLSDTSLDDAFIPILFKFPNLKSIDLRGTKISAHGLVALANYQPLQRIYFDVDKGSTSIPIENLGDVFTALRTRLLFVECSSPNSKRRVEKISIARLEHPCVVHWDF
jgi:Leucine-rich repeat (LRR) protein